MKLFTSLTPRSLRHSVAALYSLLVVFVVPQLCAQPLVGEAWRSRSPTPTGENLTSLTLAGSNTIAVGNLKTVLRSSTSTHGIAWTASKAAITENIYQESSTAYNGTKLLLCSNDGFMQSTNSGVSWSAITTNLPSFNRVYALAVQGTQFMALMETGSYPNNVVSLITSTDGATWTVVGAVPGASATVSLYVNRVAASGSRYAIVGYRYDTAVGAYQGEIWSTVDGTTWSDTVLSGATDATNLSDVIWSGQAFVAVGNGAYRSTDGVTWTPSTLGFYATCFAKKDASVNGLMVALGYDVSATSSDDGVTWTTNTSTAPVPFRPHDVLWDGTAWIAVGEGGTVYTSASAGTTWLRRYPSGAVTDFTAVASNGSNLYLALDTDFQVWASSSGSSWTLYNPSFTADGAKNLIWDGTQFVIVTNFFVWTTTDGSAFSGSGQFGPSNQDPDVMTNLAYSGGKYVAIGYNETTTATVIYSATALNNWIKRTVPAGLPPLNAITRAGTLWIAAGDDGTIVTSLDGTTWTKRTTNAVGYNFDSIASSGSITVASSRNGDGTYYTSTNGTAWVAHGNNGDGYYQFNCVLWADNNFVAINTYGGSAQTSTDGIHWSTYPTYTSANLQSMYWSGSEVLAVGEHTTMISSDLVPVINFADAAQDVFESDGTVTVTVNLSAPATSTVTLPITVDAASTAVANTDFTLSATNVVFNPGELTKTFSVSLIDNATIAANKTLKLNIAAVSGTRLGTRTSHTLTIIDDDAPAYAHFVTTAVTAPEHAGTIAVDIELSWPSPGPATVILTGGGTADSSDCFVPANVTFNTGERRKTITLSVNDDTNAEPIETRTVAMSVNLPSNVYVGSPAIFTLTIQDNDPDTIPGKRWTLRQPTPSADDLWAAAGTPTGFVVVGDGGSVLTGDATGTTWTRRFTGLGADISLNDVIWTGSMLIAPGSEGHIATSPDGIAWSDHTVPGASSSLLLDDAASTGTQHVVVGSSFNGSDPIPAIYSSSNGNTWSAAALPSSVRGHLSSVAWNGSVFTAVGYLDVYDNTTNDVTAVTLIFTSPDGRNWTDRSSALTNLFLIRVIAVGSTFVAFDDRYASSDYTSADGITWVKRSIGAKASLNDAVWNGSNKVVAVGSVTATSADGLTWVQKASPSPSYLKAVAHSNGVYVALAGTSSIYTSSDGVAWTKNSIDPETYSGLHAAVWTGTQFVAVGDNGDSLDPALIFTSPDGSAWTMQTTAVKKSLLSVAWSGTTLVAVGLNGAIATSLDGKAWATKASGTNLDLHQVIWARNQFIVVGGHETGEDYSTGTGGSIVLTSPDGTKWTRRTVPTAHPLEGLCFSGSQYVAVGRATGDGVGYSSDAEILTSPDAITWTHRSSGHASRDLQRIAFNGSVFVATDEDFGIIRSTDGITWAAASSMPTRPDTPYFVDLHDVIWTGTNFVTVGNTGISLHSTDGNTWTISQTELHSDRVWGLAWNGATLVAVGANGSIQTSGAGGGIAPALVNFALANSSVGEADGVARILVTLNSPPSSKVTVNYTLSPSTSLILTGAAADVTVPASPLIFNPGETEKYLTIAIKNDKIVDAGETLGITLTSVTGGGFLGSTITSHTLTINDDDEIPVVTAPTSHQLIVLGQPLTLSVTATAGSAPLAYQWKKNGAPVAASVIGGKSPTLYINKTSTADGGDYTCVVTNGVIGGSATSAVAKVGVYQTNTQYFRVATTKASLTQLASSNVIFHWFKGSTDISTTPGGDFTFNPSKSIATINNVASNSDLYTCNIELAGLASPFPTGSTFYLSTVTGVPTVDAITTLPAATIGSYYFYTLPTASGSEPASKWATVGLPKGLVLDPSTGLITGYPTEATTTPKVVSITATNGKGTSPAVKPTIVVNALPPQFIGKHTSQLQRNSSNNFLGGYITLDVTDMGTVTGACYIGSVKTPFTASVQTSSATEFSIYDSLSSSNYPSVLVGGKIMTIRYDYDSSTSTGSGNLQVATPGGSTDFTFHSGHAALTGAGIADYVGRHNFALQLSTPGDVGNVALPQGHGFGSAIISATGAVTFAGKTADGSVITASSPLNANGTSALYASLYLGKGSLIAKPLFTLGGSSPDYDDTTVIDTASATWSKLPDTTIAGARNYPAGWAPISLKLEGSRYNKPAPGEVVMGLNYLGVGYTNVDLTFDVEASNPTPNATLNIKSTGAIDPITYNPRKLSCVVKPADGYFSGSVDFSETLANGVLIARTANKYEGQIVRIIGNSPEQQGYGFVTYPLLPDINISPLPSIKLTPLVTSIVTLAPQ